MKQSRLAMGVILVGGLLAGLPFADVETVGAVELDDDIPALEGSPWPSTLSPYWSANVQRWEALILDVSEQRGVAPDLIASVMWKESRGNAGAIGPQNATGLMQIMPRESGFTWRPNIATLLDPSTNLLWGSGTLATVIRQGKGDVLHALAAYNGGWGKIERPAPQKYAMEVLRDFVQSVVHRHAVTGNWTGFIAVDDGGLRGPIWVVDAARTDVYLYGPENQTPEGGALIPSVPPTALVAQCRHTDEDGGGAFSVGMWIYLPDEDRWLGADAVAEVPAPADAQVGNDVSAAYVSAVSPSVMAGSARPTTAPPTVPGVVATPAVAALGAQSVSPGQTALAVSDCAGGALSLVAWPLERRNTPDGWAVRIYAESRGGNCTYTYAWNEEQNVVAQTTDDHVVFEVTSTRRGTPLLGTVVVSSGGEIRRVKLYIVPPE